MKSDSSKPIFFVRKGSELDLSGLEIAEIARLILDRGALFRFCVKGFSMSPFIKDGDIITLSPFKDHTVRIGDIVAFIHPQSKKLVIHRIIKKKGDRYLIKGDNVKNHDDEMPRKSLLGFVCKIERKGKTITYGLGMEKYLIMIASRVRIPFGRLEILLESISPFLDKTKR